MASLEAMIDEYEEQRSLEDEIKCEESTSDTTITTRASTKETIKHLKDKKGLFPESEDQCLVCIKLSDSMVFSHSCYPYPAVKDPGIEEALLGSKSSSTYSNDGQDLYLHICTETNIYPVRSFHKNLLSSEINLSYYGVSQSGIRPMAMALQYNNFVTRFDLTDNFLSDDSCYHLGKMIKTNDMLKELILTGCRIGASGLQNLGNNLHFNCSLEVLKLDRNNIGDQGGVIFANFISSAYIKEIDLSNNGMGQVSALALVDGLECRNPFTHLDLSWNDFSDIPSATKMLKQLANSDLLQELNLSFTSLEGESVASAICNVLNITELRVLDLSHNFFRGEAINLISEELINAKKLETLNLSFNPMSPRDAYVILRKMLNRRVQLHNLLMENVCVSKFFPNLLIKVLSMKNRENFVVSFGEVLKNWAVKGPDSRILLLKRAYFLGKHFKNKKRRTDMALYFFKLSKEYKNPVPTNVLMERLHSDKVDLSEQYVNELTMAFEGPPTRKARTVDFQMVSEFITRIWPDKKLPPTPPPEPEPEPEPPLPSPPPRKSKKKKGRRKF